MKIKLSPYLLCLLLAACATKPSQPTPDNNVKLIATRGSVDDLLAYHQSIRRFSQTELNKELQNLNARSDSALLSMQKAMVLGLSRDSNDLARAQAQLGNVLGAADAEQFKPLARLLVSNYAEMRRLSETVDRLSLQAKDSQRRLDQLNEKLEALKTIERTLPVQPAPAVAK